MLPFTVCVQSFYSEDGGEWHCGRHTVSQYVCPHAHSVGRRFEAAVQCQCHLCSGHHLSLLLHNHSNTSKNLKTGTQNVNTTKKGMF